MTQGHSVRCADAVRTTPDQCKCDCGGDFHGGPHTQRARALVWAEHNRVVNQNRREKYSHGQVYAARSKANDAIDDATASKEEVDKACTDFAATYMVDIFIDAVSAEDQQVARATMTAVLTPFVDEIVDADLDASDAKKIKKAVNDLHLICSLCVELLKVIDKVKTFTSQMVDELADKIAQEIIDHLGDHHLLTAVVKPVLKRALSRSISALIDLLIADPTREDLLRLIGVVTCPNIVDHPEVEEYCVKPLVKKYGGDALRQWIHEDFPRDDEILTKGKWLLTSRRSVKQPKL